LVFDSSFYRYFYSLNITIHCLTKSKLKIQIGDKKFNLLAFFLIKNIKITHFFRFERFLLTLVLK